MHHFDEGKPYSPGYSGRLGYVMRQTVDRGDTRSAHGRSSFDLKLKVVTFILEGSYMKHLLSSYEDMVSFNSSSV